MTDSDIAAEIKRLGLEMDYLADIADTLGFLAEGGGWTVEFFDALEAYSLEKKREAALRVILMSRSALPE